MSFDQRAHFDSLSAAVTAAVGANRVFDYGKVPGFDGVPGDQPNLFVLLAVERRSVAGLKADGRTGRTGWRVSTRCVGRTVDETRWALLKVATALNEAVLTIGGRTSTPIQFESDQAVAADDERYSGLSLWTYAL